MVEGNYFTAPDLSVIANRLDDLERSYHGAHSTSSNMDDTGFFSVQVLENALTVWGLNLTRWRGAEMRPYQDHPQTQLAFILNLEQHWFTLRRFGHAEPNFQNDIGEGHWFNLNSFLPEPEWVGKLYLGMVLQQAEDEGYSVFAVTQIDPSAPVAVPRTVADEIASTLPEPSSSRPGTRSNKVLASTSTSSGPIPVEGLEDEDYELQAALQASLMGNRLNSTTAEHASRFANSFAPIFSDVSQQSSSGHVVDTGPPVGGDENNDEEIHEYLDPVAASMARSNLMLQRMRAQQEFAQRELWAEGGASQPDAAGIARQLERQRDEEREAEELRRAIAESEALAQIGGTNTENEENSSSTRPGPDPLQGSRSGRDVGNRVYDDDDADLQAALKASLEQVPQGWQFPELSPQPTPPYLPAHPTASYSAISQPKHIEEDGNSELSEEAEHSQIETPVEAVSMDELRRRRLAKFGL
ncbi:hypothetical protein H0H92_007896 [Tricholoma furcatifolium]|nr:hypothetical protein H0H92_007896 [Tricholoma furcatifolium]